MSETTADVHRLLVQRQARAQELGDLLVELIDEPEAFIGALEAGLRALEAGSAAREDPSHPVKARQASDGTSPGLSARGPLVEAVQRPLRLALEEGSSASALSLAQRLVQTGERQLRLFALPCLERSLSDDPERSWQLMRQLGRGAGDSTEVDALAAVWVRGVLAEPFRWAELEQLMYSQRPMERRLAAAVLAAIPGRTPADQRDELRDGVARQAWGMVRALLGDAENTVQEALAWAIREWTAVDASAIRALLHDESAIAVEHGDGHRAWVIRDSLSAQPEELAEALRRRLAGLQRDPSAPSTSTASRQAAGFASMVAQADRAVDQQGRRYTRTRA